jgi:HTH-type transcriptional regulator / antitoxin MqsA
MSHELCSSCGGELEPQLVTHIQQFQGRWVIIENLPALVCNQCGERYFTPQAYDRVLALLHGDSGPTRTEQIDVYDAALG